MEEKSPKNRDCGARACEARFGRKIGNFLAIFSKKNASILTLKLFHIFYLKVQILSAFLKESKCYIFYPTVDFKYKA